MRVYQDDFTKARHTEHQLARMPTAPWQSLIESDGKPILTLGLKLALIFAASFLAVGLMVRAGVL